MRTVLSYLKALLHHWGALVSGGAIIGGLGLWQGSGHHVPGWIYLAIGLVGVLVASFLAWFDQHKEATELSKKAAELEKRIYDGRPLFILEVSKGHPPGNWSFSLKNCGARPARFVRIDSITSYEKNFWLRFGEIPVLYAGGHEPVAHQVSPVGSQDRRPLLEFLNDYEHKPSPYGMALGWWDISIKFRDTDEHIGEELVRLCYDVEYDVLYGTAVPYTEKSSEKIEVVGNRNLLKDLWRKIKNRPTLKNSTG